MNYRTHIWRTLWATRWSRTTRKRSWRPAVALMAVKSDSWQLKLSATKPKIPVNVHSSSWRRLNLEMTSLPMPEKEKMKIKTNKIVFRNYSFKETRLFFSSFGLIIEEDSLDNIWQLKFFCENYKPGRTVQKIFAKRAERTAAVQIP